MYMGEWIFLLVDIIQKNLFVQNFLFHFSASLHPFVQFALFHIYKTGLPEWSRWGTKGFVLSAENPRESDK